MGGLSLWHWLIVLLVIVLIFGTKHLKNAGRDLGEAVKGFKKGVRDDDGRPAELDDESRRDAQHRDDPSQPRRDTERDEQSGPR